MDQSKHPDTSSTSKQTKHLPKIFGIPILVLQRSVICLAFLITTAYITYQFNIFGIPAPLDMSTRVVYAVRGLVFSVLPMVFLVLKIATMRMAKPFDLGNNPVKQKTHYVFDVYTRVLQNTLEQTISHIVNILALSTVLTPEYFFFVPLCIFWFVLGRFAFLVGYLDPQNPSSRFYGFMISSLPNFVGILYSVYHILMN